MASTQVDAVHVEDLTKSPDHETTLGGPATTEGSAKAPAPQDVESPYDEEPEDVILSDELGKEEELDDDKENIKPHIIEDDDEDDDDDDDDGDEEQQATKSAVRGSDFSEEEADDDDV